MADEFLHVMSGEGFVTDENGHSRRLGPRRHGVFPAGGHSIWHVPHEVKKLALCRQHMPALFGFALRASNTFVAILCGPAEQAGQLRAEPAGSTEAQRAAAVSPNPDYTGSASISTNATTAVALVRLLQA